MNFKTTGLLAVILAIGIAIVLVLDKQDEKKEEEEKREGKLLNIEKEEVQELYLEPSGIHCVKDSLEWDILAPVETAGDKSSIDAVVNMFSWANIERQISEDTTEYPIFGLEPPRGKMILVHSEGRDTLFLGDKSPTGSYVFARKSGSPQVFLTTTTLQSNIEKTLFDLRDKTVVGFEKAQVRSFELKNNHGTFVLEKETGQWRIKQPLDVAADESEVTTILNRLGSERAREFIAEEPEDIASYGLANPSFKVDLILGENRATKSLFIGDLSDTRYYAKDESRKPVFLVDSAFVNILDKDLFTLRNKELAGFTTSDIDSFQLSFSGQTIVCAKDTSDVWFVIQPEKREAKSWKMSSIVREGSQLKVVEFVDSPGPLDSYGLADPQIRATFYNDNKTILDVLVGNEKDENVYVKLADDESVYLVEKGILETWQPELDDISEVPEEAEENEVEASS